MKRSTLLERSRYDIIRLCHSALDSRTLRAELLQCLRGVIPFDYAYFMTTDPATQLGTSSVLVEEPPSWCMAVFLENEFMQEDFNQFRAMIKQRQMVGILSHATAHEPQRSPRYRHMLAPMAMEDELRAIFVTDATCWGTLCLHRATSPYTADEAAYLAGLTEHIAEGLRKAFLLNSASLAAPPHDPGVLILAEDNTIIATTAAAEYWLAELRETDQTDGRPLPVAVSSVVTVLKALERGWLAADVTPKIRLHTRSGHWLVLYASRLRSSESDARISVIFEVARPAEIAPMMMQAYGFTRREGEVTQCVLGGQSTVEIAARLHISPNTVQDHLKAIFDKVDVSSRGELAARIFIRQHGQ